MCNASPATFAPNRGLGGMLASRAGVPVPSFPNAKDTPSPPRDKPRQGSRSPADADTKASLMERMFERGVAEGRLCPCGAGLYQSRCTC